MYTMPVITKAHKKNAFLFFLSIIFLNGDLSRDLVCFTVTHKADSSIFSLTKSATTPGMIPVKNNTLHPHSSKPLPLHHKSTNRRTLAACSEEAYRCVCKNPEIKPR